LVRRCDVLRFALVVTSSVAGADSVGLLLLVRAAVEHLEHLGRAGRREDECREDECREYECREYECREYECREDECREDECREDECREDECREYERTEYECREYECREYECREHECREYECREYERREHECTEDEWSACGTERGSDDSFVSTPCAAVSCSGASVSRVARVCLARLDAMRACLVLWCGLHRSHWRLSPRVCRCVTCSGAY
jgi:hypothetical protein